MTNDELPGIAPAYKLLSVYAEEWFRMTRAEQLASQGQPRLDVYLNGEHIEFISRVDVERGYVDRITHIVIGMGHEQRAPVDRLFGVVTLKKT